MTIVSTVMVLLKKIFFVLVLPVLLLLGIVMVVSITYQYLKYGSKVFSVFKRKDVSSCRDQMLWLTLDKILWYKKLLKPSYLSSNYVMIDGNGISLFNLFMPQGNITGNEIDEKVICKIGSDRQLELDNPLYKLNKDEKKINELLPGVAVKKYLIMVEGGYINISTDINVVKYNQLLYSLHKDTKYDKNQINEYLKVLLKEQKNVK